MTVNQILILMIVILSSIILIVGTYLLVIFFMNKKREKKIDSIFNPSNLVEEESLMNVMDEKRNLEFKNTENEDKFILDNSDVEIVTSNALSREEKVNPFGVDLTMRKKEDGSPIEIQEANNKNKFIK